MLILAVTVCNGTINLYFLFKINSIFNSILNSYRTSCLRTMISNRFVIRTFLYVIMISKIQTDIASSEDLADEYYNSTPTITTQFTPQDDKDAQDIVNSDRKEEVIASIVMHRDKMRRYAIQQKILTKIDPVVYYSSGKQTYSTRYWIDDTYAPQRTYNWTYTFMDLCFGLMEDEYIVLGSYLENFFNRRDETLIIIGMMLIKDMQHMIALFDANHRAGYKFKNYRKDQRSPFENMLRVWVRYNRDPIEKEKLNQDSIVNDTKTLKNEQDSDGWHENRNQLELILMKKSIIYARAVLQEFEKANGGTPIEKILNDNIECHKLNHDLADTYGSLARFIKNKPAYIADILRKYSDGSEQWAVWIMCIAVIHPQEWPKIDEAFKKDHKDDSLSKFILQKISSDKVMAEMIAMTVDPKFKPTSFTNVPIAGATGTVP